VVKERKGLKGTGKAEGRRETELTEEKGGERQKWKHTVKERN